jgi:hypothetical protein
MEALIRFRERELSEGRGGDYADMMLAPEGDPLPEATDQAQGRTEALALRQLSARLWHAFDRQENLLDGSMT